MFPTLSFANRELSPAQMSARSARAAGALAAAGINEGDTIAIMMRNEPVLMDVMLAARQLGAYFTPLNWHFKSEEVGYILQDSGARALIAHADLLPQIAAGIPAAMSVFIARPDPHVSKSYRCHAAAAKDWDDTKDWHALVEKAQDHREVAARPRGLMAYTAGTTGKPKGVRRLPPSLSEVDALAQKTSATIRAALGITAASRCLVSAPLYHSAPCGYALFASQSGAWLRIEPRFDAAETLALIERYRITHPYLVPTMYVRLLRLPAELRNSHDLTSVQFVSSTGAPCPPAIKEAMIDWWGDVINEAYASSETGYLTLITSKEARERPGSAGRPIPGVSLKIIDDDGREAPPGTIGKVYARPTGVPQFTYINRQGDRDAIERDGYVTLGDLGHVDQDGYLFIADRRTDLILSGGVNIYPAEIEHVLMAMPGVSDCAVFGIPDPEFGQAVVAVVKATHDRALSQGEVQQYLASRLANFKVPRIIDFRDELPREDTGKIFKRHLQEEYSALRQTSA
jgi:long-chain acyl-CoA synthetase